ncbi:class I SAM-dependent methyltransferase [Mastigocoleus testarum]|uniref:Methyltransferase type 12 n=1 Tax=Mastigocoleus testarum BC008 TaxID=371196 RepID=A0A0V7ZDL1_9CYAN|nr:class I SAM-dependent methyltransferase [Mastigocoleus testarum]KST62476.1 methyltransferase type 12 [Mastigocoleus testarum BC008]
MNPIDKSNNLPQIVGSNSDSQNNKQRYQCLVCNNHIDPKDTSTTVNFPCNVRAFSNESFKVWRCSTCMTIHCLDVVDLDFYYSKYPYAQAQLTLPYKIIYSRLHGMLKKYGFSSSHSMLDYGCSNGMFVSYLRERGFSRCYGYDPYSSDDVFRDPTILEQGAFDYILLQDTIEHIEDPNELLSKLDLLLAPGGYVFIGTPNAANIKLDRADLSDYFNPVHVPYHLHIYTPESLKSLVSKQGWESVKFFNRTYSDTPWLFLNTRAWNQYQRLLGGSFDVIFEPIKVWKALTSLRFLFFGIFGYWLSLHTDMMMIFRKKAS